MIRRRIKTRNLHPLNGNFNKLLTASLLSNSGRAIMVYLTVFLSQYQSNTFDMLSLYMIVMGLGNVVGGVSAPLFVTRFHLRYLLVSVYFLWALCAVLMLFANNSAQTIVVLFMLGIAIGASYPLFTLVIQKLSAKNFSLDFSKTKVASSIGAAIAGFLGAYLWNIDYHLVFVFDAIFCLFTAAVIFSMQGINCKVSEQKSQAAEAKKKTKLPKHYFSFCLLLVCAIFVFMQFKMTMPMYLKDNFYDGLQYIGVFFAMNAVMTILLQVPVTRVMQRIPVQKAFKVAVLILSLAAFTLPFATGYFSLLGNCVLWTLGELALFPFALDIAYRCAKHNNYKAISFYNGAFSLGYLLAPALGLYIYNQSSQSTLWFGCALLGAFAVVLLNLPSRKSATEVEVA